MTRVRSSSPRTSARRSPEGDDQMYPMPVSPGGHIIEHIEGDPSAIIARGKEIESLGEMMRRSGETLSAIQMRAETQQGKAVTSLRESIGDSSSVLGRAADLYEPVGPVVQTYGEELEEQIGRASCRG